MTMIKLGTAIATVLVIAVIVYGSLQAQEELTGGAAADVATAPAIPAVAPVATTTAEPAAYTGSAFTVQVRGGDNPCRYLYQGNGVGTFAGGEIVLEFIAGTHEVDLADTGEGHLYGDSGPHVFEVEDLQGDVILNVAVDRGATVYAPIVFPGVGLYALYDRLRPDLGQIGEVHARPVGTVGAYPQPSWAFTCWESGESRPPNVSKEVWLEARHDDARHTDDH